MQILNLIVIISLTVAVAGPYAEQNMIARASSISEVQNQINNTRNELNNIEQEINNLTGEQELIEEQMSDLNAEIINTMTSIGMKEEEIVAKEAELAQTQVDIQNTRQEYEAAQAREEQQYTDTVARIRKMYENSSATSLGMFLKGDGLGDMLNRMEYMEQVYSYDRKKLEEFETTKNLVRELWEQLEAQKAQLETDKSQLESDRQSLQAQKSELDTMLAKMKQEVANYDTQIKKFQQQASVQKALLQQEQAELKRLQAAQQNQGGSSSSAANGSYTPTNYTSTIDNASGSELGKKIAKYACQYIGNPYVAGGTSLTNGADCSGFTYRIYSDFNYQIPRTSYQQRSTGVGVEYSNAQPGDLVCYEGHVALYIGGGLIVHASTERTGIKISQANYRPILAVRRVI